MKRQIKLTSFDDLFENTNTVFIDNFNEDKNYELAKSIIQEETNHLFQSMKKSYTVMGYYFRGIEESKAYEKDGYKSLNEFAKAEFNLSASVVSRTININKMFSKDGYSLEIDENYHDFSNSQLQELLSINDSEAVKKQVEEKNIRPDMPVKKIREQVRQIKKPMDDESIFEDPEELEEQLPGQLTIEEWDEGSYMPSTVIEKPREVFSNTKNIGEIECIYCHHLWGGYQKIYYDASITSVECPKCKRSMGIHMKVEFECYQLLN